MGDFQSALTHGECVCARYDPGRHRALALSYASDPKVSTLTYVAPALWFSGQPDQAVCRIEEAVVLAEQIGHPASLAWAIDFAAAIHFLRRDREATLAWADRGITLATEQGFRLWLGVGLLFRSWALAQRGQGGEAIDVLQQAMAAVASAGQEVASTLFLGVAAEVYGKAGQLDEALQFLTGALAMVERNGEHFFEAQLHCTRGELLEAMARDRRTTRPTAAPSAEAVSGRAGAEQSYRRGLEIARAQQAKALELRAALRLARLWRADGRTADAHTLLGPLYGRFTEDLDSPDLVETRELLAQLRPAAASVH
jgi:adenylate cyclase